jgi:hypothetical protein
MNDVARVILYGVVAAASPAVLVLTLGILATARARLNGGIFAASFVFAQALTFLVVFLVGAVATEKEQGIVATYLELAIGIILLALAWRGRPPHLPRSSSEPNGIELRLAKFGSIQPRTCLVIGLPLGVGTKRLIITAVAGGTLAASGMNTGEDLGLGLAYVLIASSVVWVPVVAYLVLGSRADAAVSSARRWMSEHTDMLTFATALTLGALFVVDAVVKLTTG